MKRIRLIIVVAIVLAIAILAGYFDYYVYALKHPDEMRRLRLISLNKVKKRLGSYRFLPYI